MTDTKMTDKQIVMENIILKLQQKRDKLKEQLNSINEEVKDFDNEVQEVIKELKAENEKFKQTIVEIHEITKRNQVLQKISEP